MILALDATMSAIGAAVYDTEGELKGLFCLKPEKHSETKEERAMSLASQVNNLIRLWEIKEIAVEVTTGFIKSQKAARSIYNAEGGILFLAGALGLEYHAVSIYDVKLAAAGRKTGVDKHQMIAAALALDPPAPLSRKKDGSVLLHKAEHEADAVFVGKAYLQTRKYRQEIKKQVDMMLEKSQ